MIWQHVRAVILLPFTVLIVIPAIILYFTGLGGMRAASLWSVLMLVGAIFFLTIGLVLLVTTAALFAKIGRGTLAPWNPPQHLVVAGPYRHVRNPMISGLLFILLAEALFFGSLPLWGLLAFAFILNSVYIPLVEERGLEKRFGDEYRRYKQHVPRWIPRPTPWHDAGRPSG